MSYLTKQEGASLSNVGLGVWINSSDSLPEDGDEVQIAVKWGDDDICVVAGQWLGGIWYGCWFDTTDPIQEIAGEVVAWTPYTKYTSNA
jgi:hypothetical protein